MIPQIKDFLLTPAGRQIDQKLSWDRLLVEDTAELASKADFVIPVLNVIKALELNGQIDAKSAPRCVRKGSEF